MAARRKYKDLTPTILENMKVVLPLNMLPIILI